MIVVSGTITIDPANNDKMQELLEALVPATLAEDGCETYGFYHDQRAPGEWRVFEEWRDEDAMNAHMVADHLAAFMGAVGGLGVSGTAIDKYEVTAKSKLI